MTRVINQSSNWIRCFDVDTARLNYKALYKFNFIFLLTLFTFHFSLSAQKVPGYYLTNSLDTVKVNFYIPIKSSTGRIDYNKIQYKVAYFDSSNRKYFLLPEISKEYSFDVGGRSVKMVSNYNKESEFRKSFSKDTVGQNQELYLNKRKVSGYIVSNKKYTIHALFDIPRTSKSIESVNFNQLQNEVVYFDSLNIKHKLKSDSAIGFCFILDTDSVKMVSFKGTKHFSRFFLRLIIDGELRLFKVYLPINKYWPVKVLDEFPHTGWSVLPSKEINDVPEDVAYLLQKSNGKIFYVKRKISFRENLIDYLSECGELTKKIQNNESTFEDIPKIVKEYNLNCHN